MLLPRPAQMPPMLKAAIYKADQPKGGAAMLHPRQDGHVPYQPDFCTLMCYSLTVLTKCTQLKPTMCSCPNKKS